ncbi:MAG: outer membrane protein assembly factor BamB, partial [Planctomycetota bacterium]
MTTKNNNTSPVTAVRSIDLTDIDSIHGVTCDAHGHIWFAAGNGDLNCVDASDGRILKQYYFEGARSGTAFDGTHIWQITDDNIIRIDVDSGAIVRTIELPKETHCSGMAYLDGTLWIGDCSNQKIVQLDIETGEVLKTLKSDRFVTGVEWIDGELWHGAFEQLARIIHEPRGKTPRIGSCWHFADTCPRRRPCKVVED